ncbi:MAG: SAM-dependent methyltransferase [Cryomorphaceae bacterium]
MASRGKLILIPSWLHEANSAAQFPGDTLKTTHGLTYFIVERAKTARHFLKRIAYPTPFDDTHMLELDKHALDDTDRLLQPCMEGHDTGLISEAGVPGVADPGGMLVDAAHRKGIQVVPLIGPSSILLALMASGMNGQRFTFHGYLDRDERILATQLKEMEQDSRKNNTTHMFIETPYRNDKLLSALLKHLAGSTRLCTAIDLTAPEQQIVNMSAEEWKRSKKSIGKKPAVFLLFSGELST